MAFFNYELVINWKDDLEIEITRKISNDAVINFSYELAVLLESGVPILKALDLQKREAGERRMEVIAGRMISCLERGASLTEAFRQFPQVFGALYVRLVNIGEISGSLPKVLKIIARHLSERERIRKKMRTAWVYPKLVLATTFGTSIFLINYVLPKFVEILGESSGLHPLTRFLLGMNRLFRERYLLLGISSLLLFIVIKTLMKLRYFRNLLNLVKMKIPALGGIYRSGIEIGFLRNMELMTDAGVSIVQGINMQMEMEENHLFRRELENLLEGIRKGMGIKESLSGSEFLSGTSLAMIAVGEGTGNLAELLGKAAIHSEGNMEMKIEKMLHLMEPVLILFLGTIVGTVILGIYLPMFDMLGRVG